MKKLVTIFIICLTMLVNINPINALAKTNKNESNLWPEFENVFSESAILMDASSGLILYGKNIHKKHYPASITKIMTTLLAIENSSLNEIVTFSKNAIFGIERNSSHIGIDVDEELTMEQSLYGIMLESANEVSYGVAEHISGDLSSFANLMNKKAKELGCKNTNFVNANGLHDDNHYTTSYDMALIAKAAINNKAFRKITGTISYTIPPTNIQEETRYLNNHHKMLKHTKYHYDGCIGGKTGYTTKSKNTLVTFAKRGDLELICVIMHSDLVNQYKDTAALLDFGFNNYTAYQTSMFENEPVVFDSPYFTKFNCLFCETTSPLKVSSDSYIILPNTADLKDITREIKLTDKDSSNDNQIGTINYLYGEKIVGCSTINYYNQQTPELASPNIQVKNSDTLMGSIFTYNGEYSMKFKVIAGIIIFIIISYLIYFIIIERPRLKRRRIYYDKKKRKNKYDNDFINFN